VVFGAIQLTVAWPSVALAITWDGALGALRRDAAVAVEPLTVSEQVTTKAGIRRTVARLLDPHVAREIAFP